MKILEEAWKRYEARVVPRSAGVVQRTESRIAFYAGAMSAIYGLMGTLDGPDNEVTAENEAVMASLMNELKAFEAEAEARAQGVH